jgi:hypothetical protein
VRFFRKKGQKTKKSGQLCMTACLEVVGFFLFLILFETAVVLENSFEHIFF